jgi:hypothetical protein
VKPGADRDYGRELLDALTSLETSHERLAGVVDRKIECMRNCDVAGMNQCTTDEQELVRRIAEHEGRRRGLTDRLVRSYGMAPAKGRRMTAAQLADKLPPQARSDMQAVTERLRSLTTRAARRNRVAGMIGGDMLRHMGAILSAMTGGQQQYGAYTPTGRTVGADPQRLFEAVG